MAPPDFKRSAPFTMRSVRRRPYDQSSKKNLADIPASASISLCSLGQASHEYEGIQQ